MRDERGRHGHRNQLTIYEALLLANEKADFGGLSIVVIVMPPPPLYSYSDAISDDSLADSF